MMNLDFLSLGTMRPCVHNLIFYLSRYTIKNKPKWVRFYPVKMMMSMS